MKFRGFLVDARNIIGGFLLWGALFGFIAILPLASNAIDPQIHFCRKGEQRSVLLLDSRARQTFDSRKSIHSVSLATIEYVTAAARITMKYVQHPRVGWISKPAVEFNVTISSDATYEVTANFTDPDFSKNYLFGCH